MPNFFEKVFALSTNYNTQKHVKPASNVYRYWASSTHDQSFITSLQLLAAARFVLLIKGDSRAERKYWFLSFTVILMLTDISVTWLKREIAAFDNSVDYLDLELTDAIGDLGKCSTDAYRKLHELAKAIQLLKEELYEPDQDKGNNELDEGEQEDSYIEDDFLDNDDEEQDDEG